MEFPLSSSDFGQIRAFSAVAEELSFVRGAERLGISSSALSRMVRVLETQIGVRLINRTTRTMVLTEAGTLLFSQVKPAIAQLDKAIDEAKKYRRRPAGVIRVFSTPSALQLIVRPILRSFSDAFPEVVLDITLGDGLDTSNLDFDVVLRAGEIVDGNLSCLRLSDELHRIAVASPDYMARSGPLRRPDDLIKHRCIGWRPPHGQRGSDWAFSHNGQIFEVSANITTMVSSNELAIEAATNGLGITTAIKELVADRIAAGKLVPLLEHWSVRLPGIFLCCSKSRQLNPSFQAFIQAITNNLGDPVW